VRKVKRFRGGATLRLEPPARGHHVQGAYRFQEVERATVSGAMPGTVIACAEDLPLHVALPRG
jgi:hypothetical protein